MNLFEKDSMDCRYYLNFWKTKGNALFSYKHADESVQKNITALKYKISEGKDEHRKLKKWIWFQVYSQRDINDSIYYFTNAEIEMNSIFAD